MSEIDKHEFINIAILENIIEAQLIDSILNEQNIPHMVRSFYDTAYDGLFQFKMGWGELCAPLTYKQEIIDILNDVRSKNHDIHE